MPVINIKNLNKKFGANEVLRDINLTVEKGEVVALDHLEVVKALYSVV